MLDEYRGLPKSSPILKVSETGTNGYAIAGTAKMPDGSTLAWKRSSDGQIQASRGQGNHGALPEEIAGGKASYSALSMIRDELRRHDRRMRIDEHLARNYPLLPMPRPGKLISFGSGKQIYPLTAEEYGFAMDLRAAARHGATFREMIGHIEAAGFRVRPAISSKQNDGGYSLQGFSFTRGYITLQASRANLRFSQLPGEPRAVSLPADGGFLIELRKTYEFDMAPMIEAKDKLDTDIRVLSREAANSTELAELLKDNRIKAVSSSDTVDADGLRWERNILSLERDGVRSRFHRGRNRRLANAAYALLRDPGSETAKNPGMGMEP